MSYVVLARKYRPMFFQDVMGQDHVTKTLQNAIEQERIANAYIFSGPRGVGKTTVARLLSKALNCEQGPTINPCNVCSNCVEVNESRSLDVFEIDGASNRGIDEVRNLRESLRYSPNPGKYRINIIDEVHMLTNEAFNALLKTLEEPPKNVLFIFATTESHKVPATILSRCQRFDFKRITNKKIIDQLASLCEKENITVEEEALRLIAVKGDGSMRDSLSILDQIIAFAGTTITAQNVAELLGIINTDLFFKVTNLIRENNVPGGIELANQLFVEGFDFSDFLVGLAGHFRNLLVAKTTGKTGEIEVSEENGTKYLDDCQEFSVEDLLRYIKICSDADNTIRRSSNARLHLEIALVKMIKMSKSIELSQLVEHIQLEKKKPDSIAEPEQPTYHATPQPTQTVNPEPPKPSAAMPFASAIPTIQNLGSLSQNSTNTPQKTVQEEDSSDSTTSTLTLNDFIEKWPQILDATKQHKIALGNFLYEGWPTKFEGLNLVVSFSPEHNFHKGSIDQNRDEVQKAIAEVMGTKVRLKCVTGNPEELEKTRKTPPRADGKTDFKKLEDKDEMVKKIIDTFDAELIK